MGLSSVGGKMKEARKARTMRGNNWGICKVCFKMIVPGERYYAGVLGTNSSAQGLAHEECYDHPYGR